MWTLAEPPDLRPDFVRGERLCPQFLDFVFFAAGHAQPVDQRSLATVGAIQGCTSFEFVNVAAKEQSCPWSNCSDPPPVFFLVKHSHHLIGAGRVYHDPISPLNLQPTNPKKLKTGVQGTFWGAPVS